MVFHITRVRHPVDGFDWRVRPSKKTAVYIKEKIAEAVAAGTNTYSEGDGDTTLFTNKEDANDYVRDLMWRYAEKQDPPVIPDDGDQR